MEYINIKLDHDKISNSPYNKALANLFVFQSDEMETIIEDIVNGTNTCYLISGYRGAGKTSFIKELKKIFLK